MYPEAFSIWQSIKYTDGSFLYMRIFVGEQVDIQQTECLKEYYL